MHFKTTHALSALLLTAGLAMAPLPTVSAEDFEGGSLTGDQIRDRFRVRAREQAAKFRVEFQKVRPTLTAEYQQQAQAAADEARRLMIALKLDSAIDFSEDAMSTYRFADAAPQILHTLMRSYAVTGRMVGARNALVDLWERYPGYDGIDTAMEEALTCAETLQQQGFFINLEAEKPEDVITVDSLLIGLQADDLFNFLAVNGDRETIAPRAQLALARALMAEKNKDKILEARIAYDRFLLTYPQHELVFTALCELAVSHLLTYRGPKYDIGVLIDAAHLIDQAELYSKELPDRVALVKRYRQLIRKWHQERDLFAANWYRDTRRWAAARFYCQQVIERDPASETAREAQRLLADLPKDGDPEPPMRLQDWLHK